MVEVIDTDRKLYIALKIFHLCEDKHVMAGWADETPEMQAIAKHRLGIAD